MPQRFLILLIAFCALTIAVCGQVVSDSSASAGMKDSASRVIAHERRSKVADLQPISERFRPRTSRLMVYGAPVGGYVEHHTWYSVDRPLTRWLMSPRMQTSADWKFYLFLACMFYVGFLRLGFPRYMGDLFLVFRNVVHRQKQLRDQVAQYALPSFLLNLFFCISGAVFIFFLWRPDQAVNGWAPEIWIPALMILLMAVYLVKYMLLQLAGWLTGRRQEASSYAFIILMVNKVAGLLLLPMSLLLAYRAEEDRMILLGLVWVVVMALCAIRMARSYEFVSKELKINVLNYIFLVCSFEVLPILLIGKALGDRFL